MSDAWKVHSAVKRVLSRLIDMMDTQQERAKPPRFSLNEKTLPELFQPEQAGEADYVWALLKQAEQAGWISLALDKSQGLGYAEYERNPRVTLVAGAEEQVRSLLGRPKGTLSDTAQWRQAVQAQFFGAEGTKAFLANQAPIRLEGHSAVEVVRALSGLSKLSREPLFLREVSSRLFWGLSKVLDNRGALVAALLGETECPFPEAPVQLQVHIPHEDFEGVLFIENITSFEAALRGRYPAMAKLALIQSSGFRAGAKRLRTREGSTLYFSSGAAALPQARARLGEWLYSGTAMPAFFWGDLDYSGMSILRDLRTVISNLEAWRPGYEPMLARLERGLGHLPEEAGKERQSDPGKTGCPFADKFLLPVIRTSGRFVDQE